MVCRLIVAVIFLLLGGELAHSQAISHQVMVPAAAVVLKSSINYSQTIGEPIVEIISADGKVLTQGFQQKRIIIVDDGNNQGTGVETYPNPADEYVKVKMWGEKPREFTISIFSFQGARLYSAERKYLGPYSDVVEIDVSDFIRGIYFIRVTSNDKAIYRAFKFEKM
jgi:hypothetical protein